MTKYLPFLVLLLPLQTVAQDYWPMQPGQTSTFTEQFDEGANSGVYNTVSFDTLVQYPNRQLGYFNLSPHQRLSCQLALLQASHDNLGISSLADSMLIDSEGFMLYANESSFYFPLNPKIGDSWVHNEIGYSIDKQKWYESGELADSVLVIKAKGFDRELLLSKNHGLFSISDDLAGSLRNSGYKPSPIAGWLTQQDTIGMVRPSSYDFFNLQVGDVIFIGYRSFDPVQQATTIRYYIDSLRKAHYGKSAIRYNFLRTTYNAWGNKVDTQTREQYVNREQFDQLLSLNHQQFVKSTATNDHWLTSGDQFAYSFKHDVYRAVNNRTGIAIDTATCTIDVIMDIGRTILYESITGYREWWVYNMGETSETIMGSIIAGEAKGTTEIPTSIPQVADDESVLALYPNPGNGLFYFETALSKGAHLKVFTTTGQLVHQETLQSGQRQLDVSQLASGTYILQFHQNGTVQHQKLVIQ